MAGSTTYDDVSIREDLLDLMYEQTPLETPFWNLIGDSESESTVHQWTKRTIPGRVDNAQVEAGAFSLSNPTLASRVDNLTQIIWRTFTVSRTMQSVTRAAINDLFADQFEVAMIGVKLDQEHAFIRGSQASGDGTTTARRMGGLLNVVTTNNTTMSLVSLTEDILGQFIQLGFTQGSNMRHVMVHGILRQRISSFATNVTKFEDVRDQRAVRTIAIYQTDLVEPLEIVTSRDMPSALNSDPSESLVLFDVDHFAKAWLDQPMGEVLAKTADSLDGVVVSEVSLEFGDEKNAVVAGGLL